MKLRAAIVLVALAAPTTFAGWGSQGQWEPNTVHDQQAVREALMWEDSPGSDTTQIYFNGLLVHSYTGLNPNSGIIESRMIVPGPQFAIAYLGVWADCNGDDYIGMVDTMLLEYPSNALLDTSVCPPVADADPSAVFNDGLWVREFRWIGWRDNAANPQSIEPALVDDPEARVWADDGLPWSTSFVGCSANPPPGTFSSTGALLDWIDCEGERGLTGGDHACGESPLNMQVGLFYRDPDCPRSQSGTLEPGSGRHAFGVWDCNNRITVEDTEDRPLLSQPMPGNFYADPEGSVYDAASTTVGGADGQCGGGSRLDAPYRALIPEQPVTGSPVKRETTFALEFFNDRSGSYTGRVLADPDTPPNGGVTALNSLGILGVVGGSRMGSGWQAPLPRTESASPVRGDLQLAGPSYYTFYARVDPDLLSLGYAAPGGQIAYANDWCSGGAAIGDFGVDCDTTHWWNADFGASEMPLSTWSKEPIGVVPGTIYQFRDIDCYDGSNNLGVPVGTALWAEAPC